MNRLGVSLAAALAAATVALAGADTGFQPTLEPLVRVIDLNVGESGRVRLVDGREVTVRVVGLQEHRCEMRDAVRKAEVRVKVEGRDVSLVAATYHLPTTVGSVQIDCPVTRGYTQGSSKKNVWALDKDVRLRLWPAGSPWIRPGTFTYPVNQRWFASDTQMANDPCYVNACDVPGQGKVYYHYGLDFGGAEGLVDILAATDGVVVSRGGKLLDGEFPPQVQPRHDVVYIRDERGWYYRYSHLLTIESSLELGQRISRGRKIGTLGKEGGSGGWSHLHLDVTMPQPSGRYGITDGYAFILQAYRDEHDPQLLAVARPHLVAWVGDPVTLDASRSWHAKGDGWIRDYQWEFSDGQTARGPNVDRRYTAPGHYTETVKVIDRDGRIDYDFAVVQVFDRKKPLPAPPAIHAAFWPAMGLQAGHEVTFKVRTFGVRPDEGVETWDFGDGTPPVRTQSDGNTNQHAADGYAITTHRYAKPGDYLVSVQRKNDRGETATARLHVPVDPGS